MLTVYLNYSSGALCAVIKLKINYLVKRSILTPSSSTSEPLIASSLKC